MRTKSNIVPTETIGNRIVLIRGLRVMIDSDLADLYAVTTKALNQAVKRNMDRLPDDFMFRLTVKEKAEVVTNCDHLAKLKFSKSLPFAFTEHGAIQAANTLNSPQAVKMGVYVVRAFVQLRNLLASNRELIGFVYPTEKMDATKARGKKWWYFTYCSPTFVSYIQIAIMQHEAS